MATYASYRHVELDKVGCGKKRITKPPGGDASDIFGASSPTTTPPATPRKVKNYNASNIFASDRADSQPKARQRQDADSFNRLFGGKDAPDGGSPVKVKNYQKSNVLMSDGGETNGHAAKNGHTNGHSEKNGHASPNGSVNGHGSDSGVGSGSVTPNAETAPKTNGHANGTNGTNGTTNGTNGTHGANGINGNGHVEHATPTRRMPPGGFSSMGNIFSQ